MTEIITRYITFILKTEIDIKFHQIDREEISRSKPHFVSQHPTLK